MSVLLRKKFNSIKKEKLSEQAKSVLESMDKATNGFKDAKASRKIQSKFEAFYNKLKESKPEAIATERKAKAPAKKSADDFKAARDRRKSQTGVPKDKKAVDKDATRPAISKRGRRVSKAGNTYYEYRDNRLDKNPSKYPMLEKGGKTEVELMGASQNGEPKPSGYYLVKKLKTTAIVRDEDGNLEKYGKSPNFAGYHLIIDGEDYEFLTNYNEKGGYMADGGRIKVGTFDEKQLKNKEDKKAVEKAQDESGLKYVETKIIKKGGKMYMEVYLIPNEEYYNSSKFAKGGGIYSSDSLYYLQVLKDGEEVGREKFRAKNLKEATEISQDDYEDKYKTKFGDHLSFIVSEAMEEGGETPKFEVDDVVYHKGHNSVGIVRLGEERGELKTDADGNVNVDELEYYNPMKHESHKNAKIAPSTKKEIEERGLWKPFGERTSKLENGGETHRIENIFEEGGEIAEGNNQMVMSQAKAIAHHVAELQSVLTESTEVEAWVVSKMQRAATDLADITHYIDGLTPKSDDVVVVVEEQFAQGGELRYKLAGNNFGQQIEHGQKFKELISKVYENQSGEHKYPENFIRETAYTGKIVKNDGSYYLKDYMYRGTLTKFEFLDDKDFQEALKHTNRPAIRNFKFEKGGSVGNDVDIYEVELEAVPNPDYEDYDERGSIKIKKHKKKVKSVEDASMEVKRFIASNGLGSGNWSGGDVYKNGKKIGNISYNGRFWEAEYMAKGGRLSRKQKKLDLNKNGKLDSQDFKMLRAGRKNTRKK